MQILLISDVHANLRALEALLERYAGADQVWCLGDLVDCGPCPSRCIALVRECCDYVVLGNHDVSYALAAQTGSPDGWIGCDQCGTEASDAEYLLHLPRAVTVDLDGVLYHLVHGSPQNPLSGRLSPDSDPAYIQEALAHTEADVVLCGHTHKAMVCSVGGRTLVNTGTVGQPRDGNPRAQCMLIEDGAFRFERVEYDLDAMECDYRHASIPEVWQQDWIRYTRQGIVEVHGLQLGPFSSEERTQMKPIFT